MARLKSPGHKWGSLGGHQGVEWVRGMGELPKEIRLVHGEERAKRGLSVALDRGAAAAGRADFCGPTETS